MVPDLGDDTRSRDDPGEAASVRRNGAGLPRLGSSVAALHATYGVLAAIMAPLVVSVHSIVGLDFPGAATSDGIPRNSRRSSSSRPCCQVPMVLC